VKPNVGMMGFMFRKIETAAELELYHSKMPVNYLVQHLITFPLEVSVFYYRLPNEKKGTVSGFLQKETPFITGDGISTIGQLIDSHAGLRFKLDAMRFKHGAKLHQVLAPGENYALSAASNRGQGGKILSLKHEIDDQLLKVFDDISEYADKFYFGRYDIKCASVADLKAGKNFTILEYNGSGSGTQHIYGAGNSLWQGMRVILTHWNMMYKIAGYNISKGIGYWPFWKGLKFLRAAKKNLHLLKKLDSEFPAF
ncbi:MAG: hypothetical protein ABIO05_01930, partial [Ferruginibacter sp.]